MSVRGLYEGALIKINRRLNGVHYKPGILADRSETLEQVTASAGSCLRFRQGDFGPSVGAGNISSAIDLRERAGKLA